ncbi:MAG TPA: hypothetical protein PLI65_08465 [Bacteroidales bacterium]|nr:hypothetical protein [Bacteroidales bacterium]HPR56986.1 hypothetical protein [Bacteroidales bacterium]HRW96706.1 hypothetical protein [Bacteroidales bacterium]
MKKITVIVIILVALLNTGMNSYAQVRVTGHVFAEVVEATEASSNTNNTLQVQQNAIGENLELGEIVFNGSSRATCAIMVTSSELKGIDGNHVSFAAKTQFDEMSSTLDEFGKQVIKLQGVTGKEIRKNNDKAYAGQYNVIFAYN